MRKKHNSFSLVLLLIFVASTWLFVGCSNTPGGTSDPIVYNFTNRVAVIGDSISEGVNPIQDEHFPTYG